MLRKNGRDVTEGGARYNLSGARIGTANPCRFARGAQADRVCREAPGFDAFLDVLDADFKVPDVVRTRLINKYVKYGNDIDEVDMVGVHVLKVYCDEVEKYTNPRGGRFFSRFLYRFCPYAAG